jgi:hypothetical protein
MEKTPHPEDIQVNKTKFDALLKKIARTPALKEDERKVGKRPKKAKLMPKDQA